MLKLGHMARNSMRRKGRLSQEAFPQDFAEPPREKAMVLYAVQQRLGKVLLAGKTAQAAWRATPSSYAPRAAPSRTAASK